MCLEAKWLRWHLFCKVYIRRVPTARCAYTYVHVGSCASGFNIIKRDSKPIECIRRCDRQRCLRGACDGRSAPNSTLSDRDHNSD